MKCPTSRWLPQAGMVLATGLGLVFPAYAQPALSQEPLTITAQTLEVDYAAGAATFAGEVVVRQGALTLQASRLEARTTATELSSLVAQGPVTLTRTQGGQTETATGATATYTPSDALLVLTGPAVILTRGPSRLVGDRLTVNLTTQAARMTKAGGPVQATFQAMPAAQP